MVCSSSRRRKGAIGVLVSALLLSGFFLGVSRAGGGGITEPQVLELVTGGCSTEDHDPSTDCRVFDMRDNEGGSTGELARLSAVLKDTDGNRVGRYFADCFAVRESGQICTVVMTIKPGPFTQRGTIAAIGTGLPPSAITGGSGAYLNVRGDITGKSQPDGFHLFLNLIP
jgi:hypothetical protein